MRRIRGVVSWCVGAAVLCLLASASPAGEVDILIKKLVEKGILSEEDAKEIVAEIEKELKHEEQKIAKREIPSSSEWTERVRLKGDLRLRYQVEKRDGDAVERHRARIRYRLGVEADISDTVTVGAGLASGGADPRSTNQTLQDTFDTPDIRLDYAYAVWTPAEWLSIKGGKFKNPVWRTTGFMWDGDIRPEGAAARLSWDEIAYGGDGFLNVGIFMMDESADDGSDPFMWVVQPGCSWDIRDSVKLKAAVVYYGFQNEQGTTLDYTAGTNTLENGVLKYQYDSVGASAEFGIHNPFNCEYIPYWTVFGDFIYNPDPSDDNIGFCAGTKIGNERLSKQGQWQARTCYLYLEQDAWPDTFPDGDYYGGQTNSWGAVSSVSYALHNNVILVLDYIHCEKIDGPGRPDDMGRGNLLFFF